MINKLKEFYYVLKWNRAIYTMTEFILGYFIWLYIFNIPFHLSYFIFYCVVYLALFGLVYPIVYIYNDICDVEKDKLNKERLKYKPLAAWKISLNDFLGYGIIWIWLWLIIASFAPSVFILFFGIAVLFNYFYTKYLKHIFIVENFANGITHSFIRFLLWIILAIQTLINTNINIKNISKEQLLIIKQQLQNILSWEWIITIALIVLLHYIILSIWSTYKRYMEFVSFNWDKTKTRKSISRYELKTFYKTIWILNIIYIILFWILLYLHFDWFILIAWILAILWWNLAILRKKNEKLDKILLRLFAW